MLDFSKLKPLSSDDRIEINELEECCYIYIKNEYDNIFIFRVTQSGKMTCIQSQPLSIKNWKATARGYERALHYEKIVWSLKR